jgi:oligoendopeptidase F
MARTKKEVEEKKPVKRVTKKQAEKVELEAVKMYDFQFNDSVKDKSLKGKKIKVTGELASNFIAKGYGVLC